MVEICIVKYVFFTQGLEKERVPSSLFSLDEVGMFKQEKFCAIVLKILSVLAETDIIFTLPLSSHSAGLYHCPTKITAFCR